MNWVQWGFAHYVITMTLTISFLAEKFVHPITRNVDRWTGYSFSTCRLCMGFWVALVISLITRENLLAIWGLSQTITMFEPIFAIKDIEDDDHE